MTAKVNLLPQATRADAGKRRQQGVAVGIVLFVIVALGVATFLQRGVLSDEEENLAAAQRDLTEVQAEVAALDEFSELDRLLTETDEMLVNAMGDEATLAGLLQDIAFVTPTDGAFTSLSVTLTPEENGGVGSFAADAEVEASHAPGVERFLLQLERAAGFRNIFPGSSALEEDDIAVFSVTVDLGPEYRTGRYEDGLPEVDR